MFPYEVNCGILFCKNGRRLILDEISSLSISVNSCSCDCAPLVSVSLDCGRFLANDICDTDGDNFTIDSPETFNEIDPSEWDKLMEGYI